jgi:riboflavin kinase
MHDVKPEYVIAVAKLMMKGAGEDYINATSSSIATEIHKSQQAASEIIIGLENQNLIERIKSGHGYRIRVTETGIQAVRDLSAMLFSAINYSKIRVVIEGTVVSGIGEGAYYMALEGYRKQFAAKLGYFPYPGTLNVKLTLNSSIRFRERIDHFTYVLINGYSDTKRTYGWVKCYPVSINDNTNIHAHLLALERTHHDDTLVEIISPTCLKEKLRLGTGDNVKITILNSERPS